MRGYPGEVHDQRGQTGSPCQRCALQGLVGCALERVPCALLLLLLLHMPAAILCRPPPPPPPPPPRSLRHDVNHCPDTDGDGSSRSLRYRKKYEVRGGTDGGALTGGVSAHHRDASLCSRLMQGSTPTSSLPVLLYCKADSAGTWQGQGAHRRALQPRPPASSHAVHLPTTCLPTGRAHPAHPPALVAGVPR